MPIDCNSDNPIQVNTNGGPFWIRPARVTAVGDGPQPGTCSVQTNDGSGLIVRGIKADIAAAIGFPVEKKPDATASGLRLAS